MLLCRSTALVPQAIAREALGARALGVGAVTSLILKNRWTTLLLFHDGQGRPAPGWLRSWPGWLAVAPLVGGTAPAPATPETVRTGKADTLSWVLVGWDFFLELGFDALQGAYFQLVEDNNNIIAL